MTSELRAEVLTSFDRLECLCGEWRRLHSEQTARSIFTTFEWARASWLAAGPSCTLCAPVVHRGTEIVGILPLVQEGGELRFLGAEHADYNDLVCGRSDPGPILGAALSALDCGGWRRCVLENLAEGSALLAGLPSAGERFRSRTRLVEGPSCPSLLLGERREGILKEMLSKKSLRRHENKLLRAGGVAFGHVEEREEIRRQLPRFFEMHIERRALAGGRSLFLDARHRAFYEHLVDAFDPGNELRFAALSLDGRPVAYHLGFEMDGTFTWYKPMFDVDYWDYSPGEVLIKKLFEYVAGRPVTEFDFTRGDESFKDRFTNHVRQNRTVRLFPEGVAGAVLRASEESKEALKRSAWVVAVVGFLRRAAGADTDEGGEDARRGRPVSRSWKGLSGEGVEVVLFARRPGSQAETAHQPNNQAVPEDHSDAADPPGEVGRTRAAQAGRTARSPGAAGGAGVRRMAGIDSAAHAVGAVPEPGPVTPSNIGTDPLTLSQLARLGTANPALLDPPRLALARERLRRGDTVLLAGPRRDAPSCLAWIRTMPETRKGPGTAEEATTAVDPAVSPGKEPSSGRAKDTAETTGAQSGNPRVPTERSEIGRSVEAKTTAVLASNSRRASGTEEARRAAVPTSAIPAGACVLFDIWTPDGPPEVAAMQRFLREAIRRAGGQEVWTLCAPSDPHLQGAINAEGFEPRLRLKAPTAVELVEKSPGRARED